MDRDRPVTERDCSDCGLPMAMKLQNVLGTKPTNIPLLYVCGTCGCMLTVPPPVSPLVRRRDAGGD